MKSAKPLRRIATELLMWLLSLIILIPLAMILVNSVKTQGESSTMSLTLPSEFHWENFCRVISEGKMLRAFRNSMIITCCSVLLTNFAASMGSFVMARRKCRTTKLSRIFFMIGLFAPINYIPTIKVMQFLRIMNTYQGVIFLYSALMLPFTVFLYYGFVNTSVPREMDEAALLDGCNSWQLYIKIILPLMKPVITTAVLINFMNAWNDFIIPLYMLNDSNLYPMTMAVYNFYGTYVASWNLVCAAILITIAPILVIYLFGQRYIVSGMTTGALKG